MESAPIGAREWPSADRRVPSSVTLGNLSDQSYRPKRIPAPGGVSGVCFRPKAVGL